MSQTLGVLRVFLVKPEHACPLLLFSPPLHDAQRLEDVKKASLPGLDDNSSRVLGQMLERGELLEGVGGFGDGKVKGVGNGLFSGILRMSNSPAEEEGGGRRGAHRLFWCKGASRKARVTEVFEACTSAGFPLIVESDAPDKTVMGAAVDDAIAQGYTGLGKTGRDTALVVQKISPAFVDAWKSGNATEDSLTGSWSIQNLEVRFFCCFLCKNITIICVYDVYSKLVVLNTTLQQENIWDDRADRFNLRSIRSPAAMEILQRTRMSELCSSSGEGRWGKKGGELTSPVTICDSQWGGSEVTAWAMSKGSITRPHFDTHTVSGTTFFAAAAGTMRLVRRDHFGPVKRAIVVCAQDRMKVATTLGLDLDEIPTHQYQRKIDLMGLAKILTENQIRYVVMDFPGDCSYIIPPGCAHMFQTNALVESSGWLPSLKVSGKNIDVWKVNRDE